MGKITLYHNPRCGKSREALRILEDKKSDFEIIEYLKENPDEKVLKSLLKKLGLKAEALIRKGEYKKLELKQAEDEEGLIKQMAQHPILIERPIVVHGTQARIGRPPESILDIL